MSDLVTVAAFDTDYEAQVARGLLESEDVPAFVQGSLDPYSVIYPTNQFRVQIRDIDLERAKLILGRDNVPSEPEPGFDSCPECNSTQIENQTLHPKTAFALGWVFLPLLLLLGKWRNKRKCTVCDYQWQV